MPELLQTLLICLAVGAFAGVMAGLLGIGGGLVIVPALAWVFHTQGVDDGIVMHLALGTSLATIVFTSVSSVRAHHRRGAVLWEPVRRLAPGIVVGAWLGAQIADALPTATLKLVFAIFVLAVSAQIALGAQPAGQHRLPGRVGMALAGGLIGAVSGVVGIGGGSLTVPFLTWCQVPIRNAVASSAAVGLPIAVSGALGYVAAGWNEPLLPSGALGYVSLTAGAGIAAASMLTAPLGARLAHTLPTALLRRIFAGFLALVGLKMLFG